MHSKYKYNLKTKFEEMSRTKQLICKAKIYVALEISNNILSTWCNILLGEPKKVDAIQLAIIADLLNCDVNELINKPNHTKS
jgi:hypothetical protein